MIQQIHEIKEELKMFIHDDGTPGTYKENVNHYTSLIDYYQTQLKFITETFHKYLLSTTKDGDNND